MSLVMHPENRVKMIVIPRLGLTISGDGKTGFFSTDSALKTNPVFWKSYFLRGLMEMVNNPKVRQFYSFLH